MINFLVTRGDSRNFRKFAYFTSLSMTILNATKKLKIKSVKVIWCTFPEENNENPLKSQNDGLSM